MITYTMYDDLTGKIIGVGIRSETTFAKIGLPKGNFKVLPGKVGDALTQKIVDGQIVDKTLEEIEADNPTEPEIPFEKRQASITNEQWVDIIDRLKTLER